MLFNNRSTWHGILLKWNTVTVTYYRCNNNVDKEKMLTAKWAWHYRFQNRSLAHLGFIYAKSRTWCRSYQHDVTVSIQWETTICVLLFSVYSFQWMFMQLKECSIQLLCKVIEKTMKNSLMSVDEFLIFKQFRCEILWCHIQWPGAET